jgi:hypothetical protein
MSCWSAEWLHRVWPCWAPKHSVSFAVLQQVGDVLSKCSATVLKAGKVSSSGRASARASRGCWWLQVSARHSTRVGEDPVQLPELLAACRRASLSAKATASGLTTTSRL